MAFYQRIKDLREDSDKTQNELAEYLGTTAQYYRKYEKGEREIPFSRAIQLADYYNVSLDYLAGSPFTLVFSLFFSFSLDFLKFILFLNIFYKPNFVSCVRKIR